MLKYRHLGVIHITMKYLFLLATFLFLSISVQAQEKSLSCKNNETLFPKRQLSTDPENLDINADHSEVTKKNLYSLSGDVSILSDKYFLGGDKVTVHKPSKTLNAVGSVKFHDQSFMVLGNKAQIKKQDKIIYINLDDIKYHYPESSANGIAKNVSGTSDVPVFDSSTYTLCPLGNSDWIIKAKEMTLNSDNNRGIAKNATLEFLGVPILYTPYHSWVLQGRGSGFLSPSFSSYTDSSKSNDTSFQVKIPYYFNIAPDRDLLLTLNQLSSRGSVIEGKYRQLIPYSDNTNSGRVEIETHYLSKDKITNNKRWLLDSMMDVQFSKNLSLGIGINRVSDINYFKEIERSNTELSKLNSHIGLNYNSQYDDKGSNLEIKLLSESEQSLDSTNSYTKQPELSYLNRIKLDEGREINLTAVSTKFASKDNSKTTGIRTHTEIGVSRSISNNAYALTPNINLMHTNYSLDNAANQNRTIMSFGLDSKLFLEREVNIFNTDSIQTLTPRIAYNYTPDRNQSAIPNFDSTDKDDSYYGLFSSNKFTGLDRISGSNSFTLGLESDFINEQSGETYLSLKVAQSHHLDDTELNSNGVFVNRRKYSNIAASVDIKNNDLTFINSFQYDPQKTQIDKRDSSITYLLNSRKFITLAHRDNNGALSAELYGAYPISPEIHLFGGINRSISDSLTNQRNAGIVYESCCWAVRFAHNKSTYGNITNEVEFVLKGLASTSKDLSTRLEEEIPNYLANLDDL